MGHDKHQRKCEVKLRCRKRKHKISCCSSKLDKYCPPPPTDEVYNQVDLIFSFQPGVPTDFGYLEQQLDKSFPISDRLIDPQNPVFGYDQNGQLVLDGGKRYSDELTSINYRIHAIAEDRLEDATIDNVCASLPHVMEYFTSRGYQIAPNDTGSENENSFNYRTIFGYDESNNVVININPHYEDDNPVPTAIDLSAFNTNGSGITFGVTEFNQDVNGRDDRYAYPLRVPLTQDKKKFCCDVKRRNPIVYYDNITQILTFSVKCIDFLTVRKLDYLNGTSEDPTGTTEVEIKMQGFEGKYQLTTRSSKNELTSSNFANAEMLLQVSETVEIRSTLFYGVQNPPLQDTSISANYRNESGQYIGTIVHKMNGGAPSFDLSIIRLGFTDAFADAQDAWLTLPSNTTTAGDNPNTILIEKVGQPTYFVILDTDGWFTKYPFLGMDFIDNPPIPEDAAFFPPAVDANPNILFDIDNAHEYVHSVEFGLGSVFFTDTEGHATATELDAALNQGVMNRFKSNQFVRFSVYHSRALWPIGAPDYSDEAPVSTYGASVWYKWLQKTNDPNMQIIRRMNDILATSIDVWTGPYTNNFSVYGGSNRLAMKQALQELTGLDLSQEYKKFAIALSLLRNNSSIPDSYKSQYPYWVAQSAYAYNVETNRPQPGYEVWWEDFDTNTIPSQAALNVSVFPLVFDSMFPQLNSAGQTIVEYLDLSSTIYVVDPSLTSVEITNNVTTDNGTGVIAVTMHRYDPSTNAGVLTIQGPFELLNNGDSHMFDLADFQGPGLVRLIVSNLKVTDFGGGVAGINNYATSTSINRTTAKATIDVL